jgi:hypothetical protein
VVRDVKVDYVLKENVDLNVFEVNVVLILIVIVFVVVNAIDYVDDVLIDDDEILIAIANVYADGVWQTVIVIDHVVFDVLIFHHHYPKNREKDKSNTSACP